jgi:outer membrane protein OmpA-like peptidoglycan-associated protein
MEHLLRKLKSTSALKKEYAGGTIQELTMKNRMKAICQILFVMAVATSMVSAQDADELFGDGEYKLAAAEYEQLAQSNPEHYLGAAQSYTALKQWNKAIEMYELYRDEYNDADAQQVNTLIDVLRQPEQDIFVQNLGPVVNSRYDEGSPRISADGKKLYFFSGDRPGGKGNEDVWVSTKQTNGEWGAPVSMGYPINTGSNEALETINSDGSLMILFGNYEGRFGGGDLFYSANVNGKWTIPCNLGGGINSKYWEVDATISPDGRTILFTSQEHRMTGKKPDVEWYDIYISHLRNGAWTEPAPLPSVINVKDGDERAPYLSTDGRTLYFSSTSHPGFGGYDIFMSKRIGDSWDNWTTPVNLGKEINTVKNDNFISIPASGSTLYYSRDVTGDDDGYGGSDLYRMILPPEMRPDPVVTIYGNVTNQADSSIAATLFWSDFDTGERLGYSTSTSDGDYLITLPYGKRYLITANQKGYLFQTEMLDLREQQEENVMFSEKLGSELFRMRNALDQIEEAKSDYENLLNSTSTDLDAEFGRLADYSDEMNQAQLDLNESIRRARIKYLEGNSGSVEVEKNIQLTEANEGARIVLRNIYFDTGSANLRSESEQELDRLFEIMEQSRLIIEIGGHTDNVGSEDTNQELSQARAEAVRTFVVEKGINAERIQAKGYGEEEPIADNETEEGRQENRRVEIKVLGNDYGREGSGELLTQEQESLDNVITTENLYQLYRQAALAGGIPKGAACYDSGTNYTVPVTTSDNRGTTTTRSSRSSGFSSSAVSSDESAFGGSSLYFLTHTGGGALAFDQVSGAGVGFSNSTGKGERNFYGYFLGDAIGGGIEWNRFKDLNEMVNLPLSFDYGLGAYLVYNKTENEEAGNTTVYYTIGMGVPVMARLRYNMEISDIKLSPYASYQWNALNLADINPDPEVDGSTTTIRTVGTPSWLEIGARARFKFISGGLGLQMGDGNSGIMLRAGFAF